MKLLRMAALFTLLLLASISGLATPQPAHAGWNGQQISIQSTLCCVSASYLSIRGVNQNGSSVIYSRSLGFPGATSFGASGWWWKGTVLVTIGVSTPNSSRSVSCYVSVPAFQPSNWVTVRFNAQSCWKA